MALVPPVVYFDSNQNKLPLLHLSIIYRKIQISYIFRINNRNKGVTMIQNPSPNQFVQDLYDDMQKTDKKWYEYEDIKFTIIVEKSSQIKSLRAVLPKTKNIKIVAMAGHIMRLLNIDEYNTTLKDKSWFNMVKDGNIPYLPKEFKNKVKEKATSGKYRTDFTELYLSLKRATDEADVIIMAPDEDLEGCNLVLSPIIEAGNDQKILGQISMGKLDFHSLTEEIKTIDQIPYFNMALASKARAAWDWAFGINHTILGSVLLGSKFDNPTTHIGGVKTPVIRLIVDRMEHIKKFKPVKYWQFHGQAKHKDSDIDFNYIVKIKQDNKEILATQLDIGKFEKELESIDKDNEENKGKISEIYGSLGKLRWKLNELVKEFESAERDIYSSKMRKKVEGAITAGMTCKVTKFEQKNNLTQNPPLAYSLTDLQAEAGSLHSFTPAKTLAVAQKLYEGQWQSYPRTDNRYYASGEMANIKKIVPNLLGLTTYANVNIPTPYKVKTGVFNSSKITAHTGLAPTVKAMKDKTLTGENKTIFEMVATRYLIQFMEKFEYYKVEMDVDIDTEIYLTTFQNIQTRKGWRELYNPANMYGFTFTEKQTLPNMKSGDEIEILTIEKDNLATRPKPMFSDFSLLKAMENIGRIYDHLENSASIGTPATRASILEALFKSKYLIKKGKIVVASEKAITLTNLLPDEMTNPILRSEMEVKLKEIVAGNLTKAEYENDFKKMVADQAKDLYDIGIKNKIKVIDKATLPPSAAQLKFARTMEKEIGIKLTPEAVELKDELTKWLKKYKSKMPELLTEKQYNFLKEYAGDDEEIIEILKANDDRKMTNEQKFKASKKLGEVMRSSAYQQARAKKMAATKKANREARMKAMGITTPKVVLKPATKRKKKPVKKQKTKKED